jgi:hypothetical protein
MVLTKLVFLMQRKTGFGAGARENIAECGRVT